MVVKKYPLQILFIESLICLIAVIFFSKIISNLSIPYPLIIAGVYSLLAKKPIEYCKAQKHNNKFVYYGSYVIVLSLGGILIWYLGYVGELNVQKYINANK